MQTEIGKKTVKTCIYTFSGTGTALSISDRVLDILGDTTVELIPELLQRSSGIIKAGSEKIGFVFPNYFGGIPEAVRTFIRELDMENVHYVFAIVPAGGGQGYSLKFLQRELRQKGKRLNYGRYTKGINNYIVAGYYRGTSGEKQERVLHAMHEKVRLYAGEIKENRNFVERSNPFIYGVNRLLSFSSSRKVLGDTSGGDMDYGISVKCTGCGVCQKVCQADNILMDGKTPLFQHKCNRCMACIQYCPQNAILFKDRELTKSRYAHPDYPAQKMISRIQGDIGEPPLTE